MKDDELDPHLRRRIMDLPREIPPARNLWPEIEAKIDTPLKQAPYHPRRSQLIVACAAALAIVAGLYWLRPTTPPSTEGWDVTPLAGSPTVERSTLAGPGRITVGQWLETDAHSRATVSVGRIGEVRIEPNSRLRLVNTAATDHRLELARGTLSALIWAPPRLFFVETPAATAVDLGCAYTLTVDETGAGMLEVTAGYVALEHAGRESIIPAGLMCLTRPGAGPGTPFAADAPAEFREALRRFDAGEPAALPQVVTSAGSGDAITLWHLLARAPVTERGTVFDKLASLQPAPDGVTRAGILAGDKSMHDLWGQELGLHTALKL